MFIRFVLGMAKKRSKFVGVPPDANGPRTRSRSDTLACGARQKRMYSSAVKPRSFRVSKLAPSGNTKGSKPLAEWTLVVEVWALISKIQGFAAVPKVRNAGTK